MVSDKALWTTSWNTKVTALVKPQERQITSCRARAGQHARPSHKHCKACAKHAHAPYVRSETISNLKTSCLRLIPGIRCPVKQAALFPLIRKTVGISNKEMQYYTVSKSKRDLSWQTTRLNHQYNSKDAVAHIGTISILWNFHTNPYHPSAQQVETTGWRCRWNLNYDKLRVKYVVWMYIMNIT